MLFSEILKQRKRNYNALIITTWLSFFLSVFTYGQTTSVLDSVASLPYKEFKKTVLDFPFPGETRAFSDSICFQLILNRLNKEKIIVDDDLLRFLARSETFLKKEKLRENIDTIARLTEHSNFIQMVLSYREIKWYMHLDGVQNLSIDSTRVREKIRKSQSMEFRLTEMRFDAYYSLAKYFEHTVGNYGRALEYYRLGKGLHFWMDNLNYDEVEYFGGVYVRSSIGEIQTVRDMKELANLYFYPRFLERICPMWEGSVGAGKNIEGICPCIKYMEIQRARGPVYQRITFPPVEDKN